MFHFIPFYRHGFGLSEPTEEIRKMSDSRDPLTGAKPEIFIAMQRQTLLNQPTNNNRSQP
jgi:hypothetical protein